MRLPLSKREQRCLMLAFAVIVGTHWGTCNISPSVPMGLYRFVRDAAPFQRGDIVRVPAVSFGRSWLTWWLPLLKPVAGVPGDLVCVLPEGVWIARVTRALGGSEEIVWASYGPVYQEHRGAPLPVFWGCHEVEDGEVFVASRMNRSLDGRYFGMTPARDVLRTVPIWTWR